VTFAVAMAITPAGQSYREIFSINWDSFVDWVRELFS
jgi:hypothetical protein